MRGLSIEPLKKAGTYGTDNLAELIKLQHRI